VEDEEVVVKWDVKPGDLIEWVYSTNRETVSNHCTIWSSTMKERINISNEMLLISYADGVWSAFREGRFIHARVDERQEIILR
jgi:hypothetical protein